MSCSSTRNSQTAIGTTKLYRSFVKDRQASQDLDIDLDPEAEIPKAPPNLAKATAPHDQLSQALGMNRSPADLGFSEKSFDPCQHGWNSEEACQSRYLSVVHFQLLCRETDGSVSQAPRRLMPIEAREVLWSLGHQRGKTRTDAWGYGQLSAVSHQSVRGKRLILKIGSRFVGFTASEVNKIVLPKNFCSG